MGDSVAAGAGLNAYPADSCNRSQSAYPYLVAAALKYTLVNVTCAGAKTTAGILQPQGPYAPQLPKLFDAGTPKLVTITVGTNDIDWTSAIMSCYQLQCSAATLPANVKAAESVLRTNMHEVLDDISNHYGNHAPEVIVTGYYQAFSAAATCSDLRGADPVTLAASANAVMGSLNQTIEGSTSAYLFARFAPVDFIGHELCTAEPWVQGLSDKAPFHPTAGGQSAYAKAVEVAIKR
ncbi:MAG TPA: SGNH/GDSL hydrolase family protein [Candidatus Saccharimonadales bacterium]|nr:SGNH/GDSL hydrolase family protein [Candidatus Saccharimonadales bacterium]